MNKLDMIAPAKTTGGRLHESTPHDSAAKQVSGRAEYVDDLTEPEGTLHAYPIARRGCASRSTTQIWKSG